jgi:hypothetical protein
MRTHGNWNDQGSRDWQDRVDDAAQAGAGTMSDIDALVDDALDFAREMFECAMVPLRDLIANAPPPFGRGPRAPRAPWADD